MAKVVRAGIETSYHDQLCPAHPTTLPPSAPRELRRAKPAFQPTPTKEESSTSDTQFITETSCSNRPTLPFNLPLNPVFRPRLRCPPSAPRQLRRASLHFNPVFKPCLSTLHLTCLSTPITRYTPSLPQRRKDTARQHPF